MSTPYYSAILVVALVAATAGSARGEHARGEVPGRGEVTGLEMGIEGSLRVIPGGRLRWFVTVHEVVASRELRPAVGAALRVLASFRPSQPLLEVTSDSAGRAQLSFAIPAHLERAFQLVIEARSPRQVRRRFEVTVPLSRRYRTEFHVDRTTVEPGGMFHAWGRVLDLAQGRPASGHDVTIRTHVQSGRLLGPVHALRTDQRGVFHVDMQSPVVSGAFHVEASARSAEKVLMQRLFASAPTYPSLIVLARPQRVVVPPGSLEQVEVVVRTPDGRPVPRATLTGLSIPKPRPGKRDEKPVLTDARGRAQVPWRISSMSSMAEVSGRVEAVREGVGSGSATVKVRATRRPYLLAWAVEGGALIPSLPGRLYLRVIYPDGRPLPGAKIKLEAAQGQAGAVSTDIDGNAVVDLKPGATTASESCNGPTMAAVMLQVGSAHEELCLPVDPEATVRVRVRSPSRTVGQPVEVELLRRPTVATSPVVVSLLVRDTETASWYPVDQTVTTPRARHLTLRPPPEAVGVLWVRARPLLGPMRQEIRGGGTLVWSSPSPDLELRLTAAKSGRVSVNLQGIGTESASGFALALPIDEGKRLFNALGASYGQRPEPDRPPARLAGFLASHTPVDEAAPGVLQQGKVLPVAMPARPTELGLLRDPWRSRARFVRGRLGRLLRALEAHVEAHLPERLGQVAVHETRGWRFNEEILRCVAEKLDAESLSGLDGNPLTIATLHKLDPAFIYDNVARRLTRARLLRLLVALRTFVRQHALDHSWPRRGDPATWLQALVSETATDAGVDGAIPQAQLFDGWGHPFVLRPAAGGRARFRSIEPVVGYELISAGPDGRVGTGDDLYDPFGRVLGRGSLYAEAVGEDILLARLRGVELGRATIKALAEAFQVEPPAEQTAPAMTNAKSWDSVPGVLPRGDLGFRQVGEWAGAGVFRDLGQQNVGLTLTLSPEPRRYLVLAGVYGPAGETAFTARSLEAGTPLLLDVTIPPRLRLGERLVVPVRLTSLRDGQRLSLQVSSEGPIEAALPSRTDLAADQLRIVPLQLVASASRPGVAHVRLRVRGSDGAILREYEREVRVMVEGSLRAQHRGALVLGRAALALQVPPDAQNTRARLVVSGPRDLLYDPGLSQVARSHPALLGWAHALRSGSVPAQLLNSLTAPIRTSLPNSDYIALENACAAVAWSAANVDKEARPELRQVLLRVRAGLPSPLPIRAAILVALATGAPGLAASGDKSADPVAALVTTLREDAWNAVESNRSRPGVMARLAAGLLLLDRRDDAGRQLFAAARAALVRGEHGGRWLGGATRQGRDDWISTVALAIAARQVGDHALALELTRGIMPRLYLGMDDFEAAFWLLAAAVHGAFGSTSPPAVEVKTATATRRLPLREGVGVLQLDGDLRGDSIIVRSPDGAPVLARLEAHYLRPVLPSTDSPLSARLDGHIGHVGETAALEITARTSIAVARPVIEVQLPSAAELDQEALGSLARASAVRRVEPPDLQGLLRIHLQPMEARQQHRLPLPVRWLGGGTVRGLSLAAYDADRPWRISSIPARALHLLPPPEEVW